MRENVQLQQEVEVRKFFFGTKSDLRMIWPSFCITEIRPSDRFQKRSLVVGDDADDADDADDDTHQQFDCVPDLLK